MSVEKKVKYDVQGGVKNYLGKQKEVKAPLKWQSSPDHPTTELAYITEAEKNLLIKSDLHGSLKGSVNKGPSGIMSLNGFGSNDPGQNVGGGDISSAETGGGRSGMSDKDASDFRSAAINAGAGQRVNPGFFDSKNVISPAELAAAKAYRNQNTYAGDLAKGAYKNTRGGALGNFISGGGITGGIIRGLGQAFGLGKTYDQPTYDMSNDLNYNYDGEFEDDDEGTIYGDEVLSKNTTTNNNDNNDGNRDGPNEGIYLVNSANVNPTNPKELLEFIQRFRVKEPYSQIKGSDYVQEAKDIAKRMENFYT